MVFFVHLGRLRQSDPALKQKGSGVSVCAKMFLWNFSKCLLIGFLFSAKRQNLKGKNKNKYNKFFLVVFFFYIFASQSNYMMIELERLLLALQTEA